METKFKVNQKVVYPSQGVGVVTEIFEKKFRDENNLYYKIYIEASDMIVMVPVAKAEELGIRQIVSAKEAQEALELLSAEFEPITSDWKLRYQMNLDLLKKGTIKDIKSLITRYLVPVRPGRTFGRNLRRQSADTLAYR